MPSMYFGRLAWLPFFAPETEAGAANEPPPPPPFNDAPIFDDGEAEKRLTALLDGDAAPPARPAEPKSEAAPAADDAAPPETAPSGDDQTQAEPEQNAPPIEPPRSWSKEARDAWSSLPRQTQEYILSRETERDAEVRRGQNEVAESRKAVEAERANLAQERQRFQAQLQQIPPTVQARVAELQQHPFAQMTPQQRVQFAQQDPARAYALQMDYQERTAQVQHLWQAEQQQQSAWLAEQQTKLAEALPEWVAPETAPARKAEAVKFLRDVGFDDDTIRSLHDHRIYRVLDEVRKGREAIAELARMKDVAAKKVANVPPVAKPGTAPSRDELSHQKRTALRQQIGQAKSDDDAAALLAQFL